MIAPITTSATIATTSARPRSFLTLKVPMRRSWLRSTVDGVPELDQRHHAVHCLLLGTVAARRDNLARDADQRNLDRTDVALVRQSIAGDLGSVSVVVLEMEPVCRERSEHGLPRG